MYPFGTLLIEPIKSMEDENTGSTDQSYSLSVVLNRIYFGLYNNYGEIWKDIGKASNKFTEESKDEHEDHRIVAQTIKEAVVFLYLQWYYLSLERYYHLAEKDEENVLKAFKEKYKTEA